MPRLKHFDGQNYLHYLTANTYRKARIFDSDRYKRKFVQTLDDLRTELGFRIIGYVLMPEILLARQLSSAGDGQATVNTVVGIRRSEAQT